VLAPFLDHFPVFSDLVLPFLGRDQVVGIDVLETDENMANAGLRRLLDEFRNLVTERVVSSTSSSRPPSHSPAKNEMPSPVPL